MKLSKREMILLTATLTAILVALSWYIVTKKLQTWSGIKAETAQLKSQIRLNNRAMGMSDQWEKELQQLQKGLLNFKGGDQSVTPDLLKTIKKISSQHQLDITRTQPYSEKQIGDLYETGISCSWQGSLEALVYFLTDLQAEGARYDVRQLNVAPKGSKKSELQGTMVIHCAYTRSDDSEPKETKDPENP